MDGAAPSVRGHAADGAEERERRASEELGGVAGGGSFGQAHLRLHYDLDRAQQRSGALTSGDE